MLRYQLQKSTKQTIKKKKKLRIGWKGQTNISYQFLFLQRINLMQQLNQSNYYSVKQKLKNYKIQITKNQFKGLQNQIYEYKAQKLKANSSKQLNLKFNSICKFQENNHKLKDKLQDFLKKSLAQATNLQKSLNNCKKQQIITPETAVEPQQTQYAYFNYFKS